MNDLKPFRHGQEGTHFVCNKHADANECCGCALKEDCSFETPAQQPSTDGRWWVAHGRLADADDLNRWLADPEAVETIIAESEKRGKLEAVREMREIVPEPETWGSNGDTHEDQSVDESLYHDQLKVLGYNVCRNKMLDRLSSYEERIK